MKNKNEENYFKKRINIAQLLRSDLGEKIKRDIFFNQRVWQDERIKLAAPISGHVILTKETLNSISAEFNLVTKAKFLCERCLDTFEKEIKIEFIQNYSFRKEEKEHEILSIFPDRSIEIFEPIRQEIIFRLPYQIVCQKGCRGLCSRCGQNLNKKKCKHKK